MLFNSLDFAIFLPIVFFLYWFLFKKSLKGQNFLIVMASYVFYGWWDWRFLSLILFSTLVDYWVGLQLLRSNSDNRRKVFLSLSILVNLGFLGFFKYYNFFLESFIDAFSLLGYSFTANTLNIILPVGISFYTFQTLSYSIDVYKRRLQPTSDIVAFSAFVSFFPQLVAGPIERATNLLPQFYKHRKFEYTKAVEGMRQILWGLFKKVVIADNCAVIANEVFNNYQDYSGSTLLIGAVFFALQIYGDFSGYSDIAIGTAKLFGFRLMQNFATPYFSRDIAEFWRRWHISLSTWFRDYLYIPLGGSRGGKWMKVRNTFIIFIVSGFWHGANWTFIVWGALNAVYFLPLLLLGQNRTNVGVISEGRILPTLRDAAAMLITFLFTVVAWIFFRAEDIHTAWNYLLKMILDLLSSVNGAAFIPSIEPKILFSLLLLFIIVEWLSRTAENVSPTFGLIGNKIIRSFVYVLLFASILWFGGKEQEFIYFQF